MSCCVMLCLLVLCCALLCCAVLQGKVYPNSYRSGYISFDVPANFDEGSGTDSGGFAQVCRHRE